MRGNWEEVAEAEVDEDEEEKDLPTDSRIRARFWQRVFMVVSGDLRENPRRNLDGAGLRQLKSVLSQGIFSH